MTTATQDNIFFKPHFSPHMFKAAEDDQPMKFETVLCAADFARYSDGSKSKMLMTAEALASAVSRGLFNGTACYIDHPEWWTPEVKNLCGRFLNIRWEDDQVKGELHLYDTDNGRAMAELLNSYLKGVEDGEDVPELGLSIVFYANWDRDADTGEYRCTHIRHVTSCDIVYSGAIADAGIKAALSALTEPEVQTMTMKVEGEKKKSSNPAVPAAAPAKALEQPAVPETPPVQLSPAQPAIDNSGFQALERLQLTEGIINRSDLPEVGKTNLLDRANRGEFNTADQLTAAIQAKKDEYAQLNAQPTIQMGGQPPRGRGITEGDMTTSLDHARNHAAWIFGVKDAPTPEPSARKMLNLYVGMTGDTNLSGRGNADRVQFDGANAAELGEVTEDALNKALLQQWGNMMAYRWYEQLSFVKRHDGTTQDLKMVQIGLTGGTLSTVTETGAFAKKTLTDDKETISFTDLGNIVEVSKKFMRMDDLDAWREIPIHMANDAVFARSAAMAALFTSNTGVGPNLDDGNALFLAGRNNIATTAFSDTAWNTASQECYDQTRYANGKKLAIRPRYCLVSSSLTQTARTTFGYGDGQPTEYKPNAVDHDQYNLRPIVVTVPDWTDANDWAYATDPTVQKHIAIAYVNAPDGGAHAAPEVSVMTSGDFTFFNNLVMAFKVTDETAIGIADHRGLGKRNVA